MIVASTLRCCNSESVAYKKCYLHLLLQITSPAISVRELAQSLHVFSVHTNWRPIILRISFILCTCGCFKHYFTHIFCKAHWSCKDLASTRVFWYIKCDTQTIGRRKIHIKWKHEPSALRTINTERKLLQANKWVDARLLTLTTGVGEVVLRSHPICGWYKIHEVA